MDILKEQIHRTKELMGILSEQEEEKILPFDGNLLTMTDSDWIDLGAVEKARSKFPAILFLGPDGKQWVVSKEWVWQQKGVDDQPKFVLGSSVTDVSDEFRSEFNGRQFINQETIRAAKETGNF